MQTRIRFIGMVLLAMTLMAGLGSLGHTVQNDVQAADAIDISQVERLVYLPSVQNNSGTGNDPDNSDTPGIGKDYQGYLQFDVAQDPTTLVFDEAPVHEDGMPAYGNPFIFQGYIYPYGTLNGTNGVILLRDDNGNVIGSEPEFPELVIGTWICRGWLLGEGAHATSGPQVTSNQLYLFGEEYGNITLVTEGLELADSTPVKRAITGGTGPFSKARGEVTQTLLGVSPDMVMNQRFEVHLNQ